MVYAGFWRRLGAFALDFIFVMLPITVMGFWIGEQSRLGYLWSQIPSLLFIFWYNVYLAFRFGATPGKLALKMRLAMLDGTPITWRAAVIRHAVSFLLQLLSTIGLWVTVMSVSDTMYFSFGWVARNQLLAELAPAWYRGIEIATHIWVASEFITLLFNKKRRAIHDLMAGTVVIRTNSGVASESPSV